MSSDCNRNRALLKLQERRIGCNIHQSQFFERVQYWEPAKWVAKLRITKTGKSQVLFKINMAAGHGGKSGRYGAIEDVAYVYAWLLDGWGLTEKEKNEE